MHARVLQFAADKKITLTGLTFNSAEVRPGFCFFALKGVHHDGNLFIKEAVQKGAVLIVSAQPLAEDCGAAFFLSGNIDSDMADSAYEFYGRPSDELHLWGITGTKGKTSIAYLLESILHKSFGNEL